MKSGAVLLEKIKGKKDKKNEVYDKNRVRKAIEDLCDKYLLDFEDVLTFEALPQAINSTIEIITEKRFRDKYECVQIEPTLFSIMLKEVEL